MRWAVSKRERTYLYFLLAVLVCLLAARFCNRTFLLNHIRVEGDFYVYFLAASNYEQGLPFYNEGPYPLVQASPLESHPLEGVAYYDRIRPYLYLPFLAWLLIPMTHVTYSIVENAWTYVSVGVYGLSVGLFLWGYARRAGCTRWELLLFALVAMHWIPALAAFLAGQITPLLAALFLWHLWCIEKKKDYIAGAALGFAILLKFSPVVFVVLWALQRRWKVLVAALTVFVSGVFLSGVSESMYFLTDLLPHLMRGENDAVNISLTGVLHQYWFGPPWSWLTEAQVMNHTGYLYAVKAMMALLWGVVVWGAWRRTDEEGVRLLFASFLLSMLVLSPVSRNYDYLYMYFIALYLYIQQKSMGCLVLYTLLMVIVALCIVPVASWMNHLGISVVDPLFVAALLLWGVTVYVSKRRLYRQSSP